MTKTQTKPTPYKLSILQKYQVLITTLVTLFFVMLVVVSINYELARLSTIATKHMYAIGEVSDLMFEIAADAQQLSLIDGTKFEQANELIIQLKTEADKVDKYLNEIKSYKEQDKYLNSFMQQWQDYRGRIQSLKLQKFGQIGDLEQRSELAHFAYTQKKPIYELITKGYNYYLNQAYQYGQYVRLLQIITLVGLIGFLCFFVDYTFRRMRLADIQLQKAQQETQEILATVNEGLFLIDKNLVIGEQYSTKLETIFNQTNLAGKTLLEVLDNRISAEDKEATQLFVEQLYSDWVVEELIQDLNPLKQVALSYVDEKGDNRTKFLSFDFLRIIGVNKQINKVFISVVDITKELQLQNQMQLQRKQHDRQIEMISYLLSADATQISHFIEDSKQRLKTMNGILKSDNNLDFIVKANQLLSEMHRLKGDASAINLEAVVELAQQQETTLKKIQQQTEIRGDDFLRFTIGLNELIEMLTFIENLKQNLNISLETDKNFYWENYFTHYAFDIAARQNKKIEIQVIGFDTLLVESTKFTVYKDISIQLLKNAIVHGIETPDIRQKLEKPSKGQLQLKLQETKNERILSMKDDGQGINWQKLCEKAVELGLILPQQVEQLSPRQRTELLFESGMTTAEQISEDAGQGIGMDIIKKLVIAENGEIIVNSQSEQFTEFIIVFPK